MINEKCCSVDRGWGIFPLSSSLRQGMAAQVSQPLGICHPQQKNAYAMPRGSLGGEGGGVLGGMDSPKIDWCIIVALLLIQALVEDKQLRSLITRTKSLSSQPDHSSFIFSTCLLHPRGKEAEPLFVCFFFFFWGVFTWAKIIVFFFSYLKPVPYACHPLFLLAVTTAFIISVLLSELLPTVLL